MKYLTNIRDLVIIVTCVIVIDTCRVHQYFIDVSYDYQKLIINQQEITEYYQDKVLDGIE